ncbi:SDR family NAD(P)-dependent oxidoreductase [Pacificoceanicola onchidii]|uniref:SDR family NAD(P)-dependent oxidoreductase n=1 Tax=Pacificoceanicola onchidii TaxID=2562685 RepID=UPI0010A56F42|nr:SDR family NAD(P)-dependent oxidoreductase [Pacificoceanicola onchidii]
MQRALVTGGNRGIGLAIAKGLVDAGFEVIIGARDGAAGEAAAARVGARVVRLDVADPRSIAEAVQAMGAVDVLVNNAGVLGAGNVLDHPDDFEACMAVMLNGPYWLMHHLTPHMVQSGFGRVVNVSSGWGAFSDGIEGPASYGVAKAALNALTVASARTLPETVKVNAMCPGWVHTRMGGASAPRTPEEGADTAIWLATLGPDGPSGGFFRDRTPIAW